MQSVGSVKVPKRNWACILQLHIDAKTRRHKAELDSYIKAQRANAEEAEQLRRESKAKLEHEEISMWKLSGVAQMHWSTKSPKAWIIAKAEASPEEVPPTARTSSTDSLGAFTLLANRHPERKVTLSPRRVGPDIQALTLPIRSRPITAPNRPILPEDEEPVVVSPRSWLTPRQKSQANVWELKPMSDNFFKQTIPTLGLLPAGTIAAPLVEGATPKNHCEQDDDCASACFRDGQSSL